MNPQTTIESALDRLVFFFDGSPSIPLAEAEILLQIVLTSDEISLEEKIWLVHKYATSIEFAHIWALNNLNEEELIRFISYWGVRFINRLLVNPNCSEVVLTSAIYTSANYTEILFLIEGIPIEWWNEEFAISIKEAVIRNDTAFYGNKEDQEQLIISIAHKSNPWSKELPDSWVKEIFI